VEEEGGGGRFAFAFVAFVRVGFGTRRDVRPAGRGRPDEESIDETSDDGAAE
jgi:hypothetical protein